MTTDGELTPIKKDLLLKELDSGTFRASQVLVMADKMADHNKHRFYEVLAVGPEVTEVKRGDKIVLSWLNTVPSIYWNSQKITLTNESKVLAIIEED